MANPLGRCFIPFALGVLCALALVPATALADATPQADLALLNQERAAWGLPAGIVENTTYSSDCAAHDNYERQNGGQLTHQEQPGNPGYTSGGAYAGSNSILSQGNPWLPFANPFENAPIHLIQLFTPSLAHTGIDDSQGYICVFTWPGMDRPAPAAATVSTYPGNGTSGFPTSENASEGPFVPGDFVGIPQGTTAGREIFVYLDAPGGQSRHDVAFQHVSLTGPNGPIDFRTVDNNTGTIGPYLSGGIIIPVHPLPSGSTITASVTVAGPSGSVTHTWSFRTAGPSSGGSGGSSSTRCVVPRLHGKTLKKAKKALRRAHCKLGKVRGKRGKHRHVKKQKPKAGKHLGAGAKVSITLR